MPAKHLWSGWPGAFCLRCFSEDRQELCLADNHPDDCLVCVNTPCPGAPIEMPGQDDALGTH